MNRDRRARRVSVGAVRAVSQLPFALACRRPSSQSRETRMEETMMPFDHVANAGTSFVACMYDVDLRAVRGEVAARRLLDEIRARVKAGRGLRPDAAHYVNLTVSEHLDEAVRFIVIAQLGQGDGIDSVNVSGLPRFPAPARREPDHLQPRGDMPPAGLDEDAGWARLENAVAADSPVVATVLSLGEEGARVDVGGPMGTLWIRPGERPVHVGDEVRGRVVMLNVRQRRVELVRSPE